MNPYILGIESSCDETSAAVVTGRQVLSNIIARQEVHMAYGGVVPELASRAHQSHIIPVVQQALDKAGIGMHQLGAVAYTRGPGLLGPLLVGSSFAKSLSMALNIPLVDVNHVHGHIYSLFLEEEYPSFPFLCLTVSGGHTQLVRVNGYFDMEILGQTTDDAAGEAFDKAAKVLALPYPGGPLVDKLAQEGDPHRFKLPRPSVPGLDYSFSGLKTAFLYLVRDGLNQDPEFVEKNRAHLCASMQEAILETLVQPLLRAARDTGIKEIGVAGGVSANSGLRKKLELLKQEHDWTTYIPRMAFCTDNAAMIALVGALLHEKGHRGSLEDVPLPRMQLTP